MRVPDKGLPRRIADPRYVEGPGLCQGTDTLPIHARQSLASGKCIVEAAEFGQSFGIVAAREIVLEPILLRVPDTMARIPIHFAQQGFSAFHKINEEGKRLLGLDARSRSESPKPADDIGTVGRGVFIVVKFGNAE